MNPILACDEGNNQASFDLTQVLSQINQTDYNSFSFFESLEDIEANFSIITPENYYSNSTPQTLFVTAETDECFDIFQFELNTENCPPYVPEGFSPNGDTKNDFFNIQGLYDIFENHERCKAYLKQRWDKHLMLRKIVFLEEDSLEIEKNCKKSSHSNV